MYILHAQIKQQVFSLVFKRVQKSWNMRESDTSVGSNKPKESFMRRSTRRMSMIWVQNDEKRTDFTTFRILRYNILN